MRRTACLSVVASLVIGSAAWAFWTPSPTHGNRLAAATRPTTTTPARTAAGDRPSLELGRVRQQFSLAALGALVASRRADTERNPAVGSSWRALGESLLERVLLRDAGKGMEPGRPTHEELPEALVRDVDEALAAVAKAQELDAGDADAFRLEAALLSCKITGLGSAMSLRGRISAALARAEELAPNHPRIVCLRAVQLLFAPRFFGQDLDRAARLLDDVTEVLDDDERPLTFAALAAWLRNDRDGARRYLVRAIARTPANPYPREVLRRIESGEDDPFGRDVDARE